MKSKKETRIILLVILIAGVLFAGAYYYVKSLQQSLWTQSVMEVLEVTSQAEHAFEIYIEKDAEKLKSFAGKLAEDASGDSEQIRQNLSFFKGEESSYAIVDLTHGLLYYDMNEDIQELSEEQLEAYGRLDGSGIMEPYLSDYTGLNVLGYYQRFTFSDGADGLLIKEQMTSSVSREFSLSFYNDTGFSYIANSEGDILIRSQHKNSNRTFSNVFDVIELSDNDDTELDIFRSSISDGNSGVSRFMFNGEEHVFAYSPISSTDGWYLISIIPNESIVKQTNSILRVSQIFLFVVAVGLLFLVTFIFMLRRNRRNVMEKEVEIQYREQLFNILANNTDDVFLMVSMDDYSVEYVSPNVERVIGISQDEVKENLINLGRAKYNGDTQVSYETLKEIQPGKSIVRDCERIHIKTGERRNFVETVYRENVDNSDKLIAVLSDRTVEWQNQAALEEALAIAKAANESKSTFLSNMSHDIRTPMNAIVGLSVLLQRDADNPEKVRDHTRKIMASSQHLLGLINDILDMSKIESGKTTLNITELNLAKIVDEIRTIMRPQAKAKNQHFEIRVSGITDERLMGDKLRINQVLINILSNAVKYTPSGGTIKMIVQQLPHNTKNFARLRFIVRDNGIGISDEYIDDIFQPFTREVNSVTNKIQGTGLGMAITKNLVDLMGGTISVESTPGTGSIFTVDLNLRIMEEEIDRKFWDKHNISHIIIVDDDEDICTNVINTMADTGVNVEYALSGEAAIETINRTYDGGGSFDLAMLDWRMPGMDGIETSKRIHEMLHDKAPVIILTAYDWSDIENEAIKAGVDGFLPKPFFLSSFRQMLESMRNKKDMGAENAGGTPAANHAGVLSGMHFMVVEDNELNAEILMELLETSGASSELAVNGEDAFEMFINSQPGSFDMILMDVQMPVMNGYDATRAIRSSSHPLAGTIPIVAMTANAFAEDIKDAMDAGMNAHITKPIDMERLVEAVKQFAPNNGSLIASSQQTAQK